MVGIELAVRQPTMRRLNTSVTNAVNAIPDQRRNQLIRRACGSAHVKHDADWAVERLPDGTIRWTSPTGHTYDRPLDPLPIDHTIEFITDPDPEFNS